MMRITTRLLAVLGLTVTMNLAAFEPADARRGGSFGSRGMRTYDAPRATPTAPQQTAPVQRSMTTPQKSAAPAAAPAASPAAAAVPARKGLLGGMGGGLLGGLVAGGLIGMLLGSGFGGLSEGLMQTLMQVALIGGVIALLMMLFRRRPAAASAPAGMARDFTASGPPPAPRGFEMFGGGPAAASMAPPVGPALEIGLIQTDRDDFERLLREVQDAFGREDYAALRERTTPEIMSYLSEELGQNATQGQRNEVTATKLLQADVAEAWREGDAEYATAAMRYQSIDIMRDRQTGALVAGDADQPTETTELWTFVRHAGGPWKLSAIQEA